MNFTIDTIIRDDIKICQPKSGAFRFGCDSVILAYFSKMKRNWHAADAGSGSGVIAALTAKIYGTKITAIELQKNMFDCLIKTMELCKIEQTVIPVHQDIASFRTKQPFDAVICNPPYRNANTGRVSLSEEERIARFSYKMDLGILSDFCHKNLKYGGKLFFSYDADLLVDAIATCHKNRLEPKRIRFLHPDINSKATLVFIECIFGGGAEILIEPPLFQTGSPDITASYNNIFKNPWEV